MPKRKAVISPSGTIVLVSQYDRFTENRKKYGNQPGTKPKKPSAG